MGLGLNVFIDLDGEEMDAEDVDMEISEGDPTLDAPQMNTYIISWHFPPV